MKRQAPPHRQRSAAVCQNSPTSGSAIGGLSPRSRVPRIRDRAACPGGCSTPNPSRSEGGSMNEEKHSGTELLSTGVEGLDTILCGGLTPNRIYLIEGEPGTGKTTTGLQFLREGVAHGESVVYITLAET